MFLNNQPFRHRESYKQMLSSTGSLSNLFSESDSPYLVSRNVENAFCEALGADNLGRSDCSADASKDNIGIGIKTFLHGNGKTLQKIAEFNKDSDLYRGKSPKELILTIANLRNERIKFTKRTYNIDSMVYHCVTRKPNKIMIFEESMDLIQAESIKILKVSNNGNTISFIDGLHEYSFNITKSTLYKRFITEKCIEEINVKILEKPYQELAKLFGFEIIPNQTKPIIANPYENLEFIILPLFSDRGSKRHVPEKSGLNQWNASGRTRNPNEIYIPIPRWIHREYHLFFPPRDKPFQLRLPDKTILSAKVCQDNSKALMSNPNKSLGEWLLRQVMNLKEKELLTYDVLEKLNIDSVIVHKHDDHNYSIDFCEMGSYDEFENRNP
ncbi:restriction endonuclease PLD domain-containing protein [Oceanobacillus kimchii]|uniref:restriction endonuclease PLD domain-containing protein n=1 Tax=Oceanobacillus kimchii TaxID=746691 RepID=UPI000346FD94|nr:restriction endonuclease PLD domain-containing protein [Oceanobacillus kimchii]